MIYVSIACYADLDVVATVRDLFEQAADPTQLKVVVVLQADDVGPYLNGQLSADGTRWETEGLNDVGKRWPHDVYLFPLDWATGVGRPRAVAAEAILRDATDADQYLQLDCHMRFVKGWDALLLEELRGHPANAVLSTLPPGFVIATDERLSHVSTYPRLKTFWKDVPVSHPEEVPPGQTDQIAHVAGGLIFCRISTLRAAPPDPHFHFYGEELTPVPSATGRLGSAWT